MIRALAMMLSPKLFNGESSKRSHEHPADFSRYAGDSQSLIQSRWDEERRAALFERQAAARELLGGE